MDLHEAIAGRRAVRQYTAESLDKDTIRRLIGAAVLAPSAINEQPWVFTVVSDQALLDRASRDVKAHVRATMSASAYAGRLKGMVDRDNEQIFHRAPTLVLISAAAPGPWVVEDCTLAAANLMLTAHSLGLGSCWIGFAQSYCNSPEGRVMFGLDAGSETVAPIIIGYPAAIAPPVARKPPQIRWV